MSGIHFLGPQPVYVDNNQQTIHNAATVNADGNGTYAGFKTREVELHARITAWSAGTSGTATIQFTLTRIRPDGSEEGSVVGPVMAAIGDEILRLPMGPGESVKVAWDIAGGVTSYPVMSTTLTGAKDQNSGIEVDSFDRALVTIPEFTYTALADSFLAAWTTLWYTQGTGGNQTTSYTNGYLEMTWTAANASQFQAHHSRRKWYPDGHKITLETTVLFGDGTTASTDPTNTRRRVGFFADGSVAHGSFTNGFGFMTDGSGSLFAIIESTKSGGVRTSKTLLTLQPRAYRLKIIADDTAVYWYVDDMELPIYVMDRWGLAGAAYWPTADMRVVYSMATSASAPSSAPKMVIYASKVTTTDIRDHWQTPQVMGRYGAATALITGAASTQNLWGIQNDSTAAEGRLVIVRRIEVMGANSVASTAAFQYRLSKSGTQSAGTTLTVVKMNPDDPTALATVRTSPTATASGGDMWVANPGLTITAAGATNPTQLSALGNAADGYSQYVLLPGEALLMRADTNTTNWRHCVSVSWIEGAL